ncbi:MAG: SpoIIE family protein phosphatase, partial [Planctomycetes bacterium]|nr:SpoIIE family protein phosphatase [Planctomycetota bacterium]
RAGAAPKTSGGEGGSKASGGAKGRTGEHAPVRQNAPAPARQNTSDRQGGKAVGKASPRSRGGPKMALKMKFMLVMAGVTAVTMIVLGLAMGGTANKYLYGQKTLDGIETARMATQIAVLVKDRINHLNDLARTAENNRDFIAMRDGLRKDVERYLNDAITWGGSKSNSDVEGILFDCPELPELAAAGVGEDLRTGIGKKVDYLFIPKKDLSISVPEGITIYEGKKQTNAGMVSILRFKIALPADAPPKGFGRVRNNDNQMEPANVRVDIAMASIDKVKANLALTIGISVVVAIAVVLGIAHWLASSITRPLETLLRDMQVVSKGMLNHRTSASSSDEVGLLATEFNRMTESLEEAQAAVIEQEKAAYELSLAREVQQQLLPAQPPLITGWQCHSFYQGAKAVSGDYFDFIPLGNGLWGFVIADVSGKGIPGSMVMAVTRTVVRLVAPQRAVHADETLKDTNRLIAKQIKRGMFVTSFYCVLDEASGVLTYASAGHNPMVIYRAKTRTAELATTKGIALGFNEGPIFDRTIQVAQTRLEHGDALVLYTDGFPEAMNGSNEEFGEENFYKLIAANGHLDPAALVEAVVAGIAAHRGDAEQSDDLTILTVRRA